MGAPFAGNMRIGFVFAHYDDVVLDASLALGHAGADSIDFVVCSGVPSGWAERPALKKMWSHPVTRFLCHLMGRSSHGEWDRACGYEDGADEVMAIREKEHVRACSAYGVKAVGLGLLDSQYRGEFNATGLRSAKRQLTRRVEEARIEMLVTHPAGSPHRDHRRAHALAAEVGSALRIPVVTVCERPYTVCAPETCGSRDRRNDRCSTTFVLDDAEWSAKLSATRCYEGQIEALNAAAGRDWLARNELGVECYHSGDGQVSLYKRAERRSS